MLRERINEGLKEAMKAKDQRRISTLRLMNSSIKNADIDARGQGKAALTDSDVILPGERELRAHGVLPAGERARLQRAALEQVVEPVSSALLRNAKDVSLAA